MAAWVGPAIAAGASLIGKLFGGGDDKTTQTSTVNYKKLVREAEQAGFNPLTALRAGGGAGFTSTTASHPALSAWTGVTDAIGQFASAYDPEANERAKLQDDLMRAQLDNIQSETKQRMRSLEVPVKTGSTAVDWAGIPIRSAAAQNAGAPMTPELERPTVTNPHEKAHVNPFVRDGQTYEGRYGELGGSLAGLYVGYQDAKYNMLKSPPLGRSDVVRQTVWEKAKGIYNDPVGAMGAFNNYVDKEFTWDNFIAEGKRRW